MRFASSQALIPLLLLMSLPPGVSLEVLTDYDLSIAFADYVGKFVIASGVFLAFYEWCTCTW